MCDDRCRRRVCDADRVIRPDTYVRAVVVDQDVLVDGLSLRRRLPASWRHWRPAFALVITVDLHQALDRLCCRRSWILPSVDH